MPASLQRVCLSALLPLVVVACGQPSVASAKTPIVRSHRAPALSSFRSEKELQAYIGDLRARIEKERSRSRAAAGNAEMAADAAAASYDAAPLAMEAPSAAPPSPAQPGAAEDGITNVQTVGVDEGGIVKKAGDYLVVLRRGRLFSIRANDKGMQAISTVNAYGPDVNGAGAWYDEMLISGDTIVVIGYSYERGGTEVGLFNLAKDGRLAYRNTYQLTSNDYYSSNNYASRLIGKTLVFYSPIDLFSWQSRDARFPSVRHWNGAKPDAPFERIVPARDIYRSGVAEEALYQTLHTVTRCELAASSMDCHSTSVLGPAGGTFYVSGSSVYVWMVSYPEWVNGKQPDEPAQASVLRMPLDGAPPTALRVRGSPVDQMSFLEADGRLNVLVGADAKGARMWSPLAKTGGLALLRVPLDEFGDATATARPLRYRALPGGSEQGSYYGLQNRYVGPWLLYGSATQDGGSAYAVRIDRRDDATKLALQHGVERIEGMGQDALLVGSAKGDLHLSSLALGDKARIANEFVLPRMAQGESRTHGFFYKPIAAGQGVFGLPVVSADGSQASVQFLRNQQLKLRGVGGLSATAASVRGANADACVASCVDWYGDARPIFIGERLYALLGYELVEGRMQNTQVREQRRLNFAPKPVQVAR
jgi:hypothetical protein